MKRCEAERVYQKPVRRFGGTSSMPEKGMVSGFRRNKAFRDRSASSSSSLRSRPRPELGTAEPQVVVPARGLEVAAERRAHDPRDAAPRAAPDLAAGGRRFGRRRESFLGIVIRPEIRPFSPKRSPACRTGPRNSLPCPRRRGFHFRCSRRTTRWHRGFPSSAPSPSPRGRHTPTEPLREATWYETKQK